MTEPGEVLVVGPTTDNLIVDLDRLPRPAPHTVIARSARPALGGTSAGKALHLVDQRIAVTLLTTQGNDAVGEALVERLRGCGVDVRAIRTDGPSERHLNLMSATGERVSIYLQQCADVPPDELRRARAIAIAAMGAVRAVVLDLSALSRALIPEATALGREVWVDVHDYDGRDPYHQPFLEVADVVVMNGDRIGDPEPFLRALVGRGAVLAVCTLGAHGAMAVARDGTLVRVDADPVAVVDPNGAGDAFAAGLMAHALSVGGAAELTGATLVAALRSGAAQGARAGAPAELSPLLETPRR